MKNTLIIFSCLFLFSCNSKFKIGRYENKCYSTDAPLNILLVEKNNRFILIYPSSVEQLSGIWVVKNDTLGLISQYTSSLKGKDSVAHKEKKDFIIKGKKLINPQNRNCYLIFKN
ncbi:hypothetical protein [Chryseobacterium sp. JV558]|uniref:hypothetical protein n=1 Tax=Chryseobacterium sp. JV558 TaxID=2663236 RepID=UPI00299D3337|nr:hypothetical protein [Chryseobacterium sp. JV558]MDW9382625.1 hypothetical protein [Chryseobacterium sp. JV558]